MWRKHTQVPNATFNPTCNDLNSFPLHTGSRSTLRSIKLKGKDRRSRQPGTSVSSTKSIQDLSNAQLPGCSKNYWFTLGSTFFKPFQVSSAEFSVIIWELLNLIRLIGSLRNKGSFLININLEAGSSNSELGKNLSIRLGGGAKENHCWIGWKTVIIQITTMRTSTHIFTK
jgi:hypothetical protein